MTALYIIVALVATGVVAWLVANGVWLVVSWMGRASGAGERVDRFFDVEGGLSEADYLKFKEQHPHGGRG